MGEIWSAFWLIKFIASEAYKNSKLHDERKDRVVDNLQELYVAKTGKSRGRVYEIIRFSHAEQPYLIEEYQRRADGSKLFRTTGEGRKLIWGYGWGLIVALVKENWLAATAISTVIVFGVTRAIPALVESVIDKL
jgi:hypothetical protein